MKQALSHIRVLDLSRILAGPWATQILADLGAEVIKIERPHQGDDTRSWGPPYLKDNDGNDTAVAAYYLGANRGKKSLTLNISTPEGQAIIRRLAKESDFFIENYKVGDLAQYGLGYEDIRKINPRIIYCSITGFGQDGPMSHLAGYDFIIQAMGGLMSITGEKDGLPGGGPQKVGIAVADLMTGMYATVAMLAALAGRDATGTGQYIDMALLDVQVAMIANLNMNYLISGRIPGRSGNAHVNIVPYQVFTAKDAQFVIAVGNDSQFAKLCETGNVPELAQDERFTTNDGRVRNREILIPLLEQLFLTRTVEEWITSLEAVGVPCGPINNLAQALEMPQIKHRGLCTEMPHALATAGTIPLIGSPIRLSETPVQYKQAPPMLGEHTREILTDLLKMDSSTIDALAAKGIV